ncbi:peptide ABC transporter substrate-binding protein [Paenibacillus baekrokdamisoli]|uniref:Peptide ABC transporter substrate-binding protein n=1 Tax=Paenibacillus baekrokdamisoli TaxID=1712516 RepID=A0A3G9JIA9_9BACL|nr:peptide ABC transporter substrate-binding protein [Paenibacillus baekrokdamisoli]MBB3068996.1 oligopeptide transport system substrate-binding protein [Paenibacillus baekrokdamisoli]BBH23818.1 peptide ABC transporter substrate-binding protein [Paenibacillus baekrokdamisoli]
MKKNKWLPSLSIILILTVALTGCSFSGSNKNSSSTDTNSTNPASTSGKTLNVYVENEMKDLNQLAASDDISWTVLNNVGEGLYRLDKDNNPVAGLAQDVKISDDKLTYTFTLRDGIKWSNGTPITAADFKYAWLAEMNAETSKNGYAFIMTDYITGGEEYASGKGSADKVGIQAKDDKTLVVQLKQPTPYFLRLTTMSVYFPLNEAFVKSKGAGYGLDVQSLLYQGPFILTKFDPAGGATLEKNKDYWDAANVNLDKVNVRVIKEQSTALNAYKAGELDRVLLSATDVDNYKDNAEYSKLINFRTTYLQFNVKADGVSNVNIRKALELSYDTNSLANNVLKNGAEGAVGMIPALMSGDSERTFRELQGDLFKVDKAQAKAYWDQGVKELGKAPKLTLLVADDSETRDVATFMQSEFKTNLGIDVAIDTKTKKARNELMDNGNYQMGITAWGADYDDAMTYLDLWTNHSPYRGKYENKQYDELIATAKKETDDKRRVVLLLQAEKLLVQTDVATAPIYHKGVAQLIKSDVQGLVYHPYASPVEFKYVTKK